MMANRYCIVRLEYHGGNKLLLHDLSRMSKIKEAADKAKAKGLL